MEAVKEGKRAVCPANESEKGVEGGGQEGGRSRGGVHKADGALKCAR